MILFAITFPSIRVAHFFDSSLLAEAPQAVLAVAERVLKDSRLNLSSHWLNNLWTALAGRTSISRMCSGDFFSQFSLSWSIWIKGSVNSCHLCSARTTTKQSSSFWALPAWDESAVLTGFVHWAGIAAFRSIGSLRKTRGGLLNRWAAVHPLHFLRQGLKVVSMVHQAAVRAGHWSDFESFWWKLFFSKGELTAQTDCWESQLVANHAATETLLWLLREYVTATLWQEI